MTPLVAVRKLEVSLGGAPVLRDISAAVEPHQIVAVLGGNGSGKTTLIRAILGLIRHQGGEIDLFGVPQATFRGWSTIGYVPQRASVSMHATTVREIVSSGVLTPHRFGPLRRSERLQVDAALDVVGLTAEAGESFVHLSGGQQQRVLIARGLVKGPSLLVMDEPFAGVDVAHQREIAAVLDSQREHMAILIVLHETEAMASIIDRALVIEHGRLAHDGPLSGHAVAHRHEHEPPSRPPRIVTEVASGIINRHDREGER
ncbi:MAG: ATP-binding cassette domain-containing protein [Propionibacteriaceae bacterium]|nr:ATP-binding cassette domain-containing protein [Propionibacteriaceae bacterium]